MNAYEKDKDEKAFEETLNETWGDVQVCGLRYGAGYVLRHLDPIAFRCALSDESIVYCCGMCHAEFDMEDDAEECCIEAEEKEETEE